MFHAIVPGDIKWNLCTHTQCSMVPLTLCTHFHHWASQCQPCLFVVEAAEEVKKTAGWRRIREDVGEQHGNFLHIFFGEFFFSLIKKLFIAYACCVVCRKNLLQASGKRYKPWFFSIIAPSVFCFLLLFFSLFTLLEKWQMAQHASHLEPTASTES